MARTIAHEMRSDVTNAQPGRLAFRENGNRPGLIELTDSIQYDTALLSDAIADAYFQHASRRRTGAAGPS